MLHKTAQNISPTSYKHFSGLTSGLTPLFSFLVIKQVTPSISIVSQVALENFNFFLHLFNIWKSQIFEVLKVPTIFLSLGQSCQQSAVLDILIVQFIEIRLWPASLPDLTFHSGLILKPASTLWAFPAFHSKLEQPSEYKVFSNCLCKMVQTSEVLQVVFLWLILDSLKVFLLLLTSCAMK